MGAASLCHPSSSPHTTLPACPRASMVALMAAAPCLPHVHACTPRELLQPQPQPQAGLQVASGYSDVHVHGAAAAPTWPGPCRHAGCRRLHRAHMPAHAATNGMQPGLQVVIHAAAATSVPATAAMHSHAFRTPFVLHGKQRRVMQQARWASCRRLVYVWHLLSLHVGAEGGKI